MWHAKAREPRARSAAGNFSVSTPGSGGTLRHIPTETALAASTACFVVISIFSAWVCARFAPSRPGRHVLWFFVVGEVMG